MSITIKSLGYGKVAVLQNGKHIKTFTGMSAPNDARMWVANQYKSSQPDTRTGSVAKNENVHHTAAEIYRKMQEGNLKGNQEKIDANKNGKIDSEDFKILRSKKKDTCEADCKESVEHLDEKLTADQSVSKWIDDFINSDNPKFDGKSKEERRQMALGAYYAAKKQQNEQCNDWEAEREPRKFTKKELETDAEIKKASKKNAETLQKVSDAFAKKKVDEAVEITDQEVQDAYDKLHRANMEGHPDRHKLQDKARALSLAYAQQQSVKHYGKGFDPVTGKLVGEAVETLDEGLRLVSKHGDGQHTAKVYKDNGWEEYRVKFFKDGKHVGEDGDYHTDDLDDAKSTADSQIKRYNAKNEDTQSELGSHPDGYKKVGQRWKKAQKQDQQGKPEKSYEYADKPATGLTKEALSLFNIGFDGEIIAEEFDIELDEDNTSYEACLEIVKEQYGIESLRELDSEIADEFFESVEMLHNDIHAIAETYTRHEVEQRVFQHKKAGRKVSDVRYSIKQGQPYAEYTVTEPDGVQRKYIYHGNITKHERLN